MKALKTAALCVAVTMGLLTACSGKTATTEEKTTETAAAEEAQQAGDDMKAPLIEPDANGMIALSQCPTEYDGLRVEVTDENTKLSVYFHDELLQTITDPNEGVLSTGENAPVHFMDANFDGYVDIFIGQGESRTYSTLLVWNPDIKMFARVGTLGDPSYQNIQLHPATKSVYDGGSNSWCCSSFNRSIWKDGRLNKVEELIIVTDPEQYEEYEVSNAFTLRDANGNVVATADKAGQLPGMWKTVAADYGVE